MLENLATKKTTVNSANTDQISFIINLINGYNESKLIDIKAIKNEFFYNNVLTKAKKVFLDTKKIQKKGEEVFFQTIHFKQRKSFFIKCNESIQCQE